MSFEISTLEIFDRQAKRLSKHYPSFRDDYRDLLEMLQKNPMAGSDLGGGIRKVRMAIASKGKGFCFFPSMTSRNKAPSLIKK